MRVTRMSNERGIALAVAVFALVVMGALVAGIFFAGRLEQQSGQNAVYAAQAAEAAEAGLSRAIAGQTSTAMLAMAVDPAGTPTLTTSTFGSNATYSTGVRRQTTDLWLVKSVGKRTNAASGAIATRTLGQLVRLNTANISVAAGLTAIGRITVTGNSTVSGRDATASAWTSPKVNCPTPVDKAGVKYNGTLSQQGSSVINGSPASQSDPTLNSSNIFGGSNFAALKALRTLTLTGNVSGIGPVTTSAPVRCNASVQTNWGAPTDTGSVCFDYFPIIYHNGDLSISGSGSGQGVLLVEGNLNVQGRIDFYGPVIVTGSVSIRGTGSDDIKFYGGVMAQDVTLDDSRLSGNATVNYSSCAIQRALQGSATVAGVNERSWLQLYE
jgi:hypothetical protein